MRPSMSQIRRGLAPDDVDSPVCLVLPRARRLTFSGPQTTQPLDPGLIAGMVLVGGV